MLDDPSSLIPAAQYLRMSSDKQHSSLEQQSALIARFAASEGYRIVQTYEDAGRSGLTVAGRTGLQALLCDVVSGPHYKIILVADVSRWGRYQDPDEAAHYEFLCRAAGVRVRYCAEAFEDDGTMASALVKSIKRMMAGEYSRQLSDRCRAGLHRKLAAGGRHGGHAPYGFQRVAVDPQSGALQMLSPGERKSRPGDMVVNVVGPPEQVAVVRRIFRLFVTEARSTRMIARILSAEAVPCGAAGCWTSQRVIQVLRNELAIGFSVYNRTHTYLRKRVDVDPAQWIRVRVGRGIVPASVFRAAQTRLLDATRGRHTDAELIGMLRRILADHGHLSRALVKAHAEARPPVFRERFGTLIEAYRLAGYTVIGPDGKNFERGALSREDVIAALSAIRDREGYLSTALIDRAKHLPSAATLRCRYGRLRDLYKEAGCMLTSVESLKLAQSRRRKRAANALPVRG